VSQEYAGASLVAEATNGALRTGVWRWQKKYEFVRVTMGASSSQLRFARPLGLNDRVAQTFASQKVCGLCQPRTLGFENTNSALPNFGVLVIVTIS
jgi:hypothetical protein